MSIRRWVVLGSLLATSIAWQPASADPTFGIFASASNGACGPIISTGGSPIPLSDSTTCLNAFGSTSAAAGASFGGVAAGANSVSFQNLPGAADASASAAFADTLVFSATAPGVPDHLAASLNLTFAGILNAAAPAIGGAGANVLITVGFITLQQLQIGFDSDGNLVTQNFGGFGGTGTVAPGVDAFDALLTTAVQLVPIGNVLFSLQINAFTGATGVNASAVSEFSHTLKVPSGVDVFNLPDGYTVNAGDWLVNNRFVDPTAVPEPAAFALLGIGLAGMGFVRRRLTS